MKHKTRHTQPYLSPDDDLEQLVKRVIQDASRPLNESTLVYLVELRKQIDIELATYRLIGMGKISVIPDDSIPVTDWLLSLNREGQP